jgi:hypothetical protein
VFENRVLKRDHSEDGGIDRRTESKWNLGRLAGSLWSEFTWLRRETGGGLL